MNPNETSYRITKSRDGTCTAMDAREAECLYRSSRSITGLSAPISASSEAEALAIYHRTEQEEKRIRDHQDVINTGLFDRLKKAGSFSPVFVRAFDAGDERTEGVVIEFAVKSDGEMITFYLEQTCPDLFVCTRHHICNRVIRVDFCIKLSSIQNHAILSVVKEHKAEVLQYTSVGLYESILEELALYTNPIYRGE